MLERLSARAQDLARRGRYQINRRTGGALDVLLLAGRSFTRARGAEASAALGYYALLSLFPLLLFLVAVGGLLIRVDWLLEEIAELVQTIAPTSPTVILETLNEALDLRGPIGFLAAITLLWSASSFFAVLERSLNNAWPGSSPRGPVHGRLVSLAMIGVLLLLLVLWTVYTAVQGVLEGLDIALGGSSLGLGQSLAFVLRVLTPWLLGFVLFWVLYRWAPTARVDRRTAAISAAGATVAWRGLTWGFSWALGAGVDRYRLVYGSLGSLVALMVWAYLSGFVTLFGAHLAAAIGRYQRETDDDI